MDQWVEQQPEEEGINIRHLLQLVWHWLWLIILAAVVAAAATYYYSIQLPKVYESSTRVMVNQAPISQSTDYTSMITSQTMAKTYTLIMTDMPVLEAVVQQLQLENSPGELRGMITITQKTDTPLITVTVTGNDPKLCADVANTLVVVFSNRIMQQQAERYALSKQNLQRQIDSVDAQITETFDQVMTSTDPDEKTALMTRLTQYQYIYTSLLTSLEDVKLTESQSTTSLTQLEMATVPTSPIAPKVMQNTLLAALVGIMLSFGTVFLIEMLDDTVKDAEETGRKFGVPVLGIVSHFEKTDTPITQAHPRSPVSEGFRGLRTNVRFASVSAPLQKILVTSPMPGEGKTTIASNLAIVLAQGGAQVTLVDADLRRPSVHKVFGLQNQAGLTSVFLRPENDNHSVAQPSKVNGLSIVTSGQIPPNPAELLGSMRMQSLLLELQTEADLIILDTPPVLSVTDAVALAPNTDGVLIVVVPGKTKLQTLKMTIDSLRRVNAPILGIVYNNMTVKSMRGGYYRTYYYYYDSKYYDPTGRKHKKRKPNKTERPANPDEAKDKDLEQNIFTD